MDEESDISASNGKTLRRGWTTGACATAAVKSALTALLGGSFDDPVTITLPGGQTPGFALAHEAQGDDWAEAGIVKDAGDDPDVTHGATIIARVARGAAGSGITFHAGPGVGTVTKPGLPIPAGEPAINPMPRKMIAQIATEVCARFDVTPDIAVTLAIPNGEAIAQKTWNPRLGIVGGLSILGTTGIVIPYSCSAWIHSIQSGVDVARALGISHVVGSTGDVSEKAAMARLGLAAEAYLDMGDFVGGLLKYLRQHPVAQVTIAGGFAKLSKLAQGALDLHSGRGGVDFAQLANLMGELGADDILVGTARAANTANQVLELAEGNHLALADLIAEKARQQAKKVLRDADIAVSVLVTDRTGIIVGTAGL